MKAMKAKRDKGNKKTVTQLDWEQTKSNSYEHNVADPITRAKDAILYLNDDNKVVEPICREKEAGEIEKFIIEGIEEGGVSTTLYIAGMPGVGKTLTVNSVIDKLKANKKYRNLFTYHYFNAMNFPIPTNIYKSMLLKIFGEISKTNILSKLNDKFKSESENKIKVVLIDELDYLVTKDEQVLYNLFEWTQDKHSKLVLITIANTLNLPEKLKQRTLSRMGNRRIPFRSYIKSQISQIISKRLEETQIFEGEALRYACTKLSGFSCDIRRITFILTQALRLFIQKNDSKLVTIDHIKQAFNDSVKNRPQCLYISSLPKDSQIVLIYIIIQSQLSSLKSCRLSQISIRLKKHNIPYDKIHIIILQLQETGIIKLKQGVVDHTVQIKITPNIDPSDVKASIQREELSEMLESIHI